MEDKDGDEEDGYDEILIPGDYKESGQIVDDWIFAEFVTKVKAGVHVVALIDCCHSGTAMDLPYVCNPGEHELKRDSGFKVPVGGPKKKEKEKKEKKKKSKKEKKAPKKKVPKKKVPKKKVIESESEDEAEEEAQEEGQEEAGQDEEEEEYVEEVEDKKKKKKKGLFGFGRKK